MGWKTDGQMTKKENVFSLHLYFSKFFEVKMWLNEKTSELNKFSLVNSKDESISVNLFISLVIKKKTMRFPEK